MSDNVVFITGASAGLGAQMAKEFASKGYHLALAARSLDKLEALRHQLVQQAKINVRCYALDVADSEAVATVLHKAAADFGRLDIVIANAGSSHNNKIGRGDFAATKSLVDINITGAMATIDAAMRLFEQQGHGHIVGISSVASVRGLAHSGAYSASKAALATYLESLRLETLRKPNITVTCLLPGYIDTAMNQHMSHRPFLTTLEKGGRDMVNKIIAKRRHSYIPSWPWCAVAPVLRQLPDKIVGKLF